ncbi:ATP-dependent helicase, partial [bacterium]|nr:ATP-dependent helicase [bacterium]
FRAAEYQVLVATDIAARGIDVPGVSHVVNFDVPNYPEDYIHRVGRTGRATAVGDAITFVSHDEAQDFKRIEQFIGSRLERKQYGEFTYHPAESRERRDDRRRSARG